MTILRGGLRGSMSIIEDAGRFFLRSEVLVGIHAYITVDAPLSLAQAEDLIDRGIGPLPPAEPQIGFGYNEEDRYDDEGNYHEDWGP
jgi:hypothetical protein